MFISSLCLCRYQVITIKTSTPQKARPDALHHVPVAAVLGVNCQMSRALAIVGNILAFLIFGAGLLSPLTPSTGMPSIGSLITFVGLPLVLMLNAWRHYTQKISKWAVVLQAMGILGFTGWLLLLQVGAFTSGS